MSPAQTFERVYLAIKQRLFLGLYKPGTRLDPTLLSDELSTSVTPVREALYRLTGERLVESPRHDGFRTPVMTEMLLRQLYQWHLDLLLLAVTKDRVRRSESVLVEERSSQSADERANQIFRTLAKRAGNPELVLVLLALAERLGPVQRIEKAFLEGTEKETDEILAALQLHDRKKLRRSLVSYHRRREQIIPELLAALLEA
jgi:DNA-binding GntR family transcriptional regulator